MTECNVCVEKYNKTVHLKCDCPHCGYASCRKCIQEYMLTVEAYTIPCMSCKKHWTIDTVDNFITKSFRTHELKQHRETILMDRERALLPATQPEVQRVIKIHEYRLLLKTYNSERRELNKKIDELNRKVYDVYRRADKNAPPPILTIHCPVGSCNGFVESVNWNCGLCKTSVCKKCHEPKPDDTHVCIDANIQTAKMIKKDLRRCPGCSVPILKVSGCDQMWCTQCQTTFSWSSGEVITGRVHNPHFYEWMRNNAQATVQRELGDIPCGGLISLHQLKKLVAPLHQDEIRFVFNTHRDLLDIQDVRLPFYRTDVVTNNMDLRIKFLMNSISAEKFKEMLQKREKQTTRYREIYDVLEMFLFTSIDMINNLTMNVVTMFPTFEKEITELTKYGNSQLAKISKRYDCVVPVLGDGYSTMKY